jgi:hypothetical protein
MRVTLLVSALILPAGAIAGEGTIKITLDGRWSGNALDGTEIAYDFSPDGSVTWHVEEANFKKMFPRGLAGKYRIRVAEPNWEMDITDFDHPQYKDMKFLAILKIIDARSIRLDGLPGRRPKEFGKEAIVLQARKE